MKISSLVLMGTCLVAPTALAAQAHNPARLSFEARAGYTIPTRELGRTGILGTPRQGYLAFEEMEAGPIFGAGLAAHLSGPFSVRMTGDYAPETDARGQFFCEITTPCPAVLQLVEAQVRRWSVGADLQLRLPHVVAAVEPTLFVGVVRRTHQVRWESPILEVPIPTSYDRSSYYLRPGIGVSRSTGPVALFLEAEAVIGDFGETP
ncbi:MAG: hypothetical protein OEO23_10375, partial [Gemmatimonadota bacterium]|nr:hypothetical protein [Gemmatimonadota bacterium]